MQPVRSSTGRYLTARSATVPSIPTIVDVGVCAADFPWDATGLVRVKRSTDDVVVVAGSGGLQLRVTSDCGTSPSSRGASPSIGRAKMGVAGTCQNFKESKQKSDLSDQSVVMRDSSLVSKGRKKKKIFRKSQTLPDDLCSLDGSQGQEGSSEHSSKPKKKVKKSRRHCDIHGSRRGSGGAAPPSGTDPHTHAVQLRDALTAVAEGADRNSNSSPNNELVCTCKPKKSRRPDPEGRSSTGPRILSEYDKIIFGNEPLFSDYDDDDPSTDEQIRGEVERYHKRSQHSDIFAAAQMVNTNTMLKFAIIATELQNIINVSLKRVTP